jgi:hypothetical protein
MKTPQDLKRRLIEFEGSIDEAWSNIKLAADFSRLREEIDQAFGDIYAEPVRACTKADFLAVDDTTRWPPS